MAKYRPVDQRVWSDRRFLACGDDARLLWLFLLTCPSLPIPGVIIGGDASLAEQLGWTVERFQERFRELCQTGLGVAREGRIVWLKNALQYQPPANPNMLKGWAKTWDDVPEGQLKHDLWQALKIACKSWSSLFAKLFEEPFQDGSANRLPNGFDNGLGNGFAHEHEHQHEHQHDQEEDLSRAIPPSPAQPPRGGDSPPPSPEQSHQEAHQLWCELEQARVAAASARGVEVQPLTMFDPGKLELARLLAAARTGGPVELGKFMRQARHAIAMAKQETVDGAQPLQWFTGAVFSPNNFRRLVGKTTDDAKQVRAGPRAATGRYHERSPEQPRKTHIL